MIGLYFHVLLISAGLAVIWFKSPAFVSLMQIIYHFGSKVWNHLELGDEIYTHEEAIQFCNDYVSYKLCQLLNCKVCFSFWTTLLLSSAVALFSEAGFLFVLTCALVAPMLNCFVLETLLRSK